MTHAAARSLSIRTHLMLWYVATLAVVLAVVGYGLNLVVTRLVQLELDQSLREESQALAAGFDPATGRIDADGLGFPSREGWLFVLVDPTGNVLQSGGGVDAADVSALVAMLDSGQASRPDATYQPAQPGAGSHLPVTYAVVSAPIERGNQHEATLLIAAPRPSDLDIAHRHLLGVLGIFVLTLLLGALPGYWLAGRAMRPVQEITRLAREIGETDLSRRLRMDGSDEIGELARTFDAMLERLEAAFDRQRQFTADASHELRTPVSIISLEAQRALERERGPEAYREALTTIRLESERMAALVADLLALARADGGQTPVQRERVDLSDVALEVVERMAPVARQHALQVTVGTLPEVSVVGDRALLSRMIGNLLDNAIKYSAGCGGAIDVSTGVTCCDGASLAWVRVDDDGPGIAPADLPHLFDRFYRADGARTECQDGHGLGLDIARWVARAHGGQIVASNRPAGGARFEVQLPLVDPSAGCQET